MHVLYILFQVPEEEFSQPTNFSELIAVWQRNSYLLATYIISSMLCCLLFFCSLRHDEHNNWTANCLLIFKL